MSIDILKNRGSENAIVGRPTVVNLICNLRKPTPILSYAMRVGIGLHSLIAKKN